MDLVERTGSTARHPWEVARGRFFLRLLESSGALATGTAWLDVGSGDMWFAERLRRCVAEAATITCWDSFYTEDDLERAPDGVVAVADPPDGRYDRVLLLDVMEHVADDLAFLETIVSDLVAADGLVLVSVPAHPRLFGAHDRALRHHRRYSPGGARALLQRAGLTIEAEGGLFHSLLPVRAGQALAERVRPPRGPQRGIGDWRGGPLLTRALTATLAADTRLSLALAGRRPALPGLSYWALCRRRGPA